MKSLLLALALLNPFDAFDNCPNCGAELPVPVAQDDVTAPEWVVIFDIPAEPQNGAPGSGTWLNLRVITRADREGQAILKATRYAQLLLDGRAFERMKFVEVAPKAPPEDKK